MIYKQIILLPTFLIILTNIKCKVSKHESVEVIIQRSFIRLKESVENKHRISKVVWNVVISVATAAINDTKNR